MPSRRPPRLLLVPTQVSMAYTAARGWHTVPTPAPWFLEDAEDQLERDVDRTRAVLSVHRATVL